MKTTILRQATRHADGLRTWPALPVSLAWAPPVDIALVPRALNPRALHADHPNSPLLSWPCPLTGRIHAIALSRHRGRERQAMRREVVKLMREGTPKAIAAARRGPVGVGTDATPNALAA